MTSRFERLSIKDSIILVSILAIVAIFTLTSAADASTEDKTSLVSEIKITESIKVPEIPSVQKISDWLKASVNTSYTPSSKLAEVQAQTLTPAPITVEVQLKTEVPAASVVTAPVTPGSNVMPPKTVGEARVYMHEPQIRAYVCPVLGDKCNTFIAILKAENGTHECTRDNRGLNRNGTVDIGLTQINWSPSSPYTFQQLQDCKFNLDIALKKYATRGFQPWAAYNSGRYLRHMPAVLASAATIEAAAKTEETASLPLN